MLLRLGAGFALMILMAGYQGCAALGTLGIVPLRISEPPGRSGELRLQGPSLDRPLGGAALRLWARVENPNGFGLTLSQVTGDLHIEEAEAIAVDFPLGLPLVAQQDTIIPLDVSIRFDHLPRLAGLLRSALTGDPLSYRLEGSFGVDAGALGTPRFGPLTLLTGTIRVR
jgi:Late embryogenesis abundant protein